VIIAERTFDTKLIRSIMTNDAIWKTVSQDGQSKADYIPYVQADCWLKMLFNNICVGVFGFESVNKITIQVHPAILAEYRGKIGHEAGIEHLRWIYENEPTCMKIVATIPVIYKHVKLYANMLGYRDEGINRASYMKNGRIHDQWMLGITREEIARVIS